MIDKQFFAQCAAEYGFELTPQQLEQFDLYAKLLVEWNEKMNLTAITQPRDIVIKHFLDSILALKAVELPQGASLVDVGSGAGFPSVPMLILRPDLKMTLLDSLNKRLIFLEEVLKELDLDATLLHARAEDAGRREDCRGKFDFALSRAVAPLPVLTELTLPLLKQGGKAICYKGPAAEEEVAAAKRALDLLRGKATILSADAPWGERRLVVIEKTAPTPKAYPRKAGTPSKNPL